MGTPKVKQRPKYLRHKATGQARVRINGRDFYLGRYGSDDSRQLYDDLIGKWLADQDPQGLRLTLDDLCLLYIAHCDTYYRKPDGRPTGEAGNIRAALRPLLANATFEDLGPTENSPLYGWNGFGNRAGDATLVRGGANAAKIFGTFTSATGFSQPSGLSQVFMSSPNQRWKASAYFAHVAADRLMGGNVASIMLEWLNSAGNVIRTDSTPALTANSPTGSYIQSVVDAAAPSGTTRGRLTLLFTQAGFSAGAALIDDVMLEPLSPCGGPIALDATAVCPCSIADIVSGGGVAPGDGVVDGSDFIAFINAFVSGDMLADLPTADGTQQPDGVVDGGDFIAFINAFSLGC